jgi:hypothetical protein
MHLSTGLAGRGDSLSMLTTCMNACTHECQGGAGWHVCCSYPWVEWAKHSVHCAKRLSDNAGTWPLNTLSSIMQRANTV